MLNLLAIGTGGFLGAIARYGVSSLTARATTSVFPYGTLLVNVLGCFAIGALAAVVEDGEALSQRTRLFLTTGLLGSFTTFSTFGSETVGLVRDGHVQPALWNAAGSLALGLGAVVAGGAMVRALVN